MPNRSTTNQLELLHPFLCLNYQEPAKEFQKMKNIKLDKSRTMQKSLSGCSVVSWKINFLQSTTLTKSLRWLLKVP